MVLKIIISCDDLICQVVLSPFDLNLNSKQRDSREVIVELFHLHLCSRKSPTWHRHFFYIVKGFKILTLFLPSPKMWGVVQSDFEFQKWNTFFCCKNAQTNFRNWLILQG